VGKYQRKKEKLFDLYSKNLSINSNLIDWFICPLCHKGFQKEHIDSLTIEHIIPQALGGKLLTLTCWKCNSDYGSKLLSKLIENIRLKEVKKGVRKRTIDANFSIDGYSVATSYLKEGKGYTLTVDPNRSNPNNIEYIQNQFEMGKVKDFNINFKAGYGIKTENKALLLISYLFLFYQFGYLFVFSHFGLHIRSVLTGETKDSPLLSFADISDFVLDNTPPLVLLCSKPDHFKDHAFVQIPLLTEYSRHVYGAFIPFLPGTKVDEKAYKIKGPIEIKGAFPPKPSIILKDPKFKLPGNLTITSMDDEQLK
jgi:hypothetical protein